MGTETRVGIVAGLAIVVIASVYFFYGSTPGEDELLIATATRVSEPPKIPETADQKSAARETPRQGASPDRTAQNRPRGTQQPVQRPPQRLEDRLATGPRPSAAAPAPTPRTQSDPSRRVPVVLADASRPPSAQETPAQQPISLRTSPSPELVEATWDNLVKSGEKPSSPQGSDYGTIADRIRSAVSSDVEGNDTGSVSSDPTRTASTDAVRAANSAPSRPSTVRPESRPPMITPRTTVANPASSLTTPTQSPLQQRPPMVASTGLWPKKHVIREGDTLEAISQQYYDRRTASEEILAANPQVKSPRHLRIGDTLTIPGPAPSAAGSASTPVVRPAEAVSTEQPPSRAAKTYTVVSGDTLYGIAQKQLGSGPRWEEILRLNKALLKGDPKRLAPGMALQLPE